MIITEVAPISNGHSPKNRRGARDISGENTKNQTPVELVLFSPTRRCTTNQKKRMIEESYASGNKISQVAGRKGINPNLLQMEAAATLCFFVPYFAHVKVV